ncbi:unnamed protein product [Ceutorhynchus assimilis]|uniref:C2H2-type domain-containing protein n=1 Tax=Ceutorhynchus assimilis TaxID=467358 RepID=A0A9N9QPH5_9CUCU|nr:unnamed protein product [Ceutorhynchus assimilis]
MGVHCFECDKVFSTQSNYNRHRSEVHGLDDKVIIEYACEVTMFKCEECGISFKKNENLRHHLVQKHNLLNIDHCEKLAFNSYEDFKNWLSTEQNTNNVEFVRLTGVKRTSSKETCRMYWNCIRSGNILFYFLICAAYL